jgi:RNA polymerase sigma factor (sigma-70 family)
MTIARDPLPFDDARLLAEGKALRALARSLLRRGDDADDVVQGAFAAAAARRRQPAHGLGPWLHGTVRHLARMLRRGELRRTARERKAARGEQEGSGPAVLAQQAEVVRDVAAAVHALPEPYRSVVLLRYWCDLPPATIAVHLGVPRNTVRSQLQRGLALLRSRLDQRYGDRERWSAPLALLGVVMQGKLLLFGAALAVAAAIGLSFVLAPAPPPSSGQPVATAPIAPAAADGTPFADAPVAAARREEVATAAPTALRLYPAVRERSAVDGVVVDAQDLPLPGARVAIEPVHGGIHPWLAIGEDRAAPPPATADAAGRFRFDGVPDGPWRARAVTGDGRAGAQPFAAPLREGGAPLIVRAEATAVPAAMQVLATDADGAGVAGARVELFTLSATESFLAADAAPARTATTAADGTCSFPGCAEQSVALRATAADGRVAVAVLAMSPHSPPHPRATLQLCAPAGIRGALTGVPAAVLAGSRVQALRTEYPNAAYCSNCGLAWTATVSATGTATGTGGAFTFAGLAPGQYALVLDSPRGLRLLLPKCGDADNSVAPWTVQLAAGAVAEATMAVGAGATIRGRVHTPAGAAIAGARVLAVLAPSTSNFPDGFELHGRNVWRLDYAASLAQLHREAHAQARTDAAGRYELRGLHPGRHRVEVFADGYAYDQRTQVEVKVDAPTELEQVLDAAGVLQGVVGDGSYLAVLPPGSTEPEQYVILPSSGLFTFPGLLAGDWVIASGHSDASVPFRELGRAHVDAGRTTWVDLRDVGDCSFGGRVVDAEGQPLQGIVKLYQRSQRLRADGSFAFALLQPLRRWFEQPTLQIDIEGLHWRLAVPDGAIGQKQWSGDFALGAGRVRLRLLDERSLPLPGRVELGSRTISGNVDIGADGVREVRNLPAGDYKVTATAPDRLVPQATFALPGPTEIVLRAVPVAPIDVLFVDRHDRPVAGHTVLARLWTGGNPPPTTPAGFVQDLVQYYHAVTAADGRARVLAPPGTALVGFSGEWELHGGEPEPQIVHTTAGVPTAVTLRLP